MMMWLMGPTNTPSKSNVIGTDHFARVLALMYVIVLWACVFFVVGIVLPSTVFVLFFLDICRHAISCLRQFFTPNNTN